MSKVIKGVGIALAVVVGALTLGAAIPALAPVLSSTVGGFFTVAGKIGAAIGLSGATAIFAGAAIAGGALGALSAITGPAADIGVTGQALAIEAAVNPQAAEIYTFGITWFSQQLIFQQQVGDDTLVWVGHLASHQVHAVDEFWHNGEQVSFAGDLVTATGDFADALWFSWRVGDGTATTPLQTGVSGVTWDGIGADSAHFMLVMQPTEDKPQIVSQNIRIHGRGRPLYDPRLDSARGGSGSATPYDKSTYVWGNRAYNLSNVALNLLLGERAGAQPRWGLHVPLEDIDWDDFIVAANICDETAGTSGLFKYQVHGSLDLSQPTGRLIDTVMAHCGGRCWRKLNGLWGIWIPKNDLGAPDHRITTQDFLTRVEIIDGDVEGVFNTVRGRYSPKDALGQLVDYPTVKDDALIAADGGEFALDLDFPLFTSAERAQYVARYYLRRSRYNRQLKVMLDWRFIGMDMFDTVEVDAPEFGYADEVMRIVSLSRVPGQGISVTLMEEHSSIYDQSQAVSPNPAISSVTGWEAAKIGTFDLQPEAASRLGFAYETSTKRVPYDDELSSTPSVYLQAAAVFAEVDLPDNRATKFMVQHNYNVSTFEAATPGPMLINHLVYNVTDGGNETGTPNVTRSGGFSLFPGEEGRMEATSYWDDMPLGKHLRVISYVRVDKQLSDPKIDAFISGRGMAVFASNR